MCKRPDGTWDFSGELVDRVPPQIGPGRDRDPIYRPLGRKAFAAIIEHLEGIEAHLKGRQQAVPAVQELLNACRAHGSVFDTKIGEPDKHGDKLLVWVEDLDFPGEERQCGPRRLPPELHAALLLTTAPGGSIRHNYKTRKKTADGDFSERDKRRSHLSFGRGTDGNIRLLRILIDAPPGMQVHRLDARRDPESHREYRPKALQLRFDDDENVKFGRAGYSAKGRKDAIELAAQHWQVCLERGWALPTEMSAEQFQALLAWAWEVSDTLYRR